jgi:hypothetical protein
MIGCGARKAVIPDEPIVEASGVTVDELTRRFCVRPFSPGG